MRLAASVATATLAVALAGCEPEAHGSPLSCPANVIAGVLEPLGMPGSIGIMSDGRHLLITWTNGYRSAEVNGQGAVLSPAGEVVARAGDPLEISGSEVRPGEWLACGSPRPRSAGSQDQNLVERASARRSAGRQWLWGA